MIGNGPVWFRGRRITVWSFAPSRIGIIASSRMKGDSDGAVWAWRAGADVSGMAVALSARITNIRFFMRSSIPVRCGLEGGPRRLSIGAARRQHLDRGTQDQPVPVEQQMEQDRQREA